MNCNNYGIINPMIKEALKKRQKGNHSPHIALTLLGHPQLLLDNSPVRLAYQKAEALLYYLAATGRSHSRAVLAALLWSQASEKQARNSLRNALYTIKQGLQPSLPLIIERDTICPDPNLIHLDITRFQAGIEQGSTTAALYEALALWRGPFLDGLYLPDAPAFEEWLGDQRARFENLYHQGLFHLARRYMSEKQLPQARQALETLLASDPLYEAAHQHLMRLYLQMGNRAAALRQYETLRLRLVEELGVDPAPATQALHLEILHADERPTVSPPALTFSLTPVKPTRFIGRKRELSILNEVYGTIHPAGPARLVMLEGEPGIGKTRLAREWLAALRSARILTTRCFEAEQTIPFQPWIDLIRTTLKQIPLSKLGLADVWLTELAHLVPEIRLQRPDLEITPLTDPELARGRIIQAIYQWLETLCRDRPLCLFIDDWQWLDQASLTLLRYTLRPQQSQQLPLLLIGAQRQAETISGWPQLKALLEREDILQQVPLYRLSPAEVADLARSMGLSEQIRTSAFLDRLLRETEGNPLFVTEIIQALDPANLKIDEKWPIPPTIQDVIQSRLARLAGPTYQIVVAAAVLGRAFTDTMLHQIGDRSLEEILHALDEAVAANLITEQTSTYDFTHDKIRAVLLDGLTQSRRRYLHLRIAQALVAAASKDFGWLSYHFEMGGDLLQARNYGLQAARQAVELYADEDALRWYEKVEALCAVVPAGLPSEAISLVTPFQQAHVSRSLPLDVLGLTYRQWGLIYQRIGHYDQAEAAFMAALQRGQSRQRLDEQAAAHNLLSFLAYLRSDYDGVGNHARRALDLATAAGETALKAPGLRHLGIAVYRTADYTRARQLYDEALAAYQEAEDRLGLAGVYNNIGFVLRTQAHYREAIDAFQQALTIYEELGQVEGIALIFSNIGRTYAFSGDLPKALHHLKRGLALSEESHTDWITVKIHRHLGGVFTKNNQWDQALIHAKKARTLADNLGSDEDLGATFRLLAEIAHGWPGSNLGNPTAYFKQSVALLKQVGAQDELERAEAAFAAYQTALD